MTKAWNHHGGDSTQDPPSKESPFPSLSTGHESIGAALLLLLLLIIYLWPAALGGQALLPADLIFSLDPLWRPLAPQGYAHPANHLLSDQVYLYHPWRILTVETLAQGRLPLWNPQINGGQPFVGNAQSAVFGPFNVLSYALPLLSSYVVTAVLRLLVAGAFSFLFAREVGLSRNGALLAMLAFTFSGPSTMWLGYPISHVVVWLPAMLFTIERALRRRSAPYMVTSGLIIGAQLLGGHPETSFHVMATWTAYAVFRTIALEGWRPARVLPQLLRIAGAAALGVMLAAVQMLPFVEALLHSATLATRQADAAGKASSLLRAITLEWHQWPTAITTLLPQYFGTPIDESYLYPYSNYIEQNAYAGVLPLVLAAAGTLRNLRRRPSPRRSLVLFFAPLAGACLGIAVRLPLLNVVNYLPILNVIHNERLRLIYVFAIAMLAGLGLDEMGDSQGKFERTTLHLLLLLGSLSLLLIAAAYGGLVMFEDRIIHIGRSVAEAQWGTPYYSRPLEYYYARVQEMYERIRASFLPGNIVMYLPCLTALVYLALHRGKKMLRASNQVLAYTLLGLTALDLFLVGMPFTPAVEPAQVFPTPGAIRYLQQDPGVYRASGTGLILHPNSGMVFGISDIRGNDVVAPRRFANLIERLDGHYRLRNYSLLVATDSPLLDLLNVKYMLTDQQLHGRWELVYRGEDGVDVYRNRDALSRAFVVYRVEIAGSPSESLARITDPSFDFRRRAVLEQMPAGWEERPDPPTTAAVQITAYETNRVCVELETAGAGLLVLTDTYMPGWRARLDGQDAQVYVADHAFRAVVVPAGAHRVEFEYRPLAFGIGWIISLTTACGTVAAIGVLVLWQPRRREDQRCHSP